MEEKDQFRVENYLTQPPSWEDPDDISEEAARENAAAFMAAAARGGSGVRA